MPVTVYEPSPAGRQTPTAIPVATLAPLQPLGKKAAALRRSRRTTSLEEAATATAPLPPRAPSSSVCTPSTTSSSSSSSSTYPAATYHSAPTKRVLRRNSSTFEYETPFESHLQDIYDGLVDVDGGLAFFESHGYYDVSDANTVAMFRQNFGMKQQFWDGDDEDAELFDQYVTVDLAGMEVLSVGSLLSKKPKRARTISGRFQLLDDEGNEIDAEAELEAEKARRLKQKQLELDEFDLAELAQEQVVLAKAISVIQTEKTRFSRIFIDAFNDEMQRTAVAVQEVVLAQPSAPLSVQLPPYSGYLYVLKDTIPNLFRSWHKRWLYFDFNLGVIKMFKRSYWKAERGSLDMRTVSSVSRMNLSDVRVECYDGRTLVFRSKNGEEAEMWLNLLQFGRRQVANNGSSALTNDLPAAMAATAASSASTSVVTQPSTAVVRKTMFANGRPVAATAATTVANFFVSTKIRGANDKSVLEVIAKLMAKPTTNSITAA
ncbi:hypothetical protein Poli38472_013212 [Pythium oligandrum]|uniref:PH domain-containing protein n=1 Tax=Pythium oligandrum TaxID=41045 RepID=A0A8K1FAQ9_PYTOL|nr:hypothetical protein Poli38472_013212 [Pythium oligandrum]|eukprot:TMW55321.1 hypothetical protein Poli38472_013212 [Pythium oligandrum]